MNAKEALNLARELGVEKLTLRELDALIKESPEFIYKNTFDSTFNELNRALAYHEKHQTMSAEDLEGLRTLVNHLAPRITGRENEPVRIILGEIVEAEKAAGLRP